jgi:hypothetical protein
MLPLRIFRHVRGLFWLNLTATIPLILLAEIKLH